MYGDIKEKYYTRFDRHCCWLRRASFLTNEFRISPFWYFIFLYKYRRQRRPSTRPKTVSSFVKRYKESDSRRPKSTIESLSSQSLFFFIVYLPYQSSLLQHEVSSSGNFNFQHYPQIYRRPSKRTLREPNLASSGRCVS